MLNTKAKSDLGNCRPTKMYFLTRRVFGTAEEVTDDIGYPACLFKWSAGESKWGTQVHPFHGITGKDTEIWGFGRATLAGLTGYRFRHGLSAGLLNISKLKIPPFRIGLAPLRSNHAHDG